jgi:hypothetical protein
MTICHHCKTFQKDNNFGDCEKCGKPMVVITSADQPQKPEPSSVREWEVLKCSNNGDKFIHGPDTNDNEFVKVIEKSAYDALKAQVEELEKNLREDFASKEVDRAWESSRNIERDYKEQLAASKAREAELVAVVKQIDHYGEALISAEYREGSPLIVELVMSAREALKEHKGES